MAAHGLVERAARPAIGLHAEFLLHFFDCRDGDRTDAAIGIADIVAAGDEQALQLAPLAARQARIVGRPWCRERQGLGPRSLNG